MTELDDLRAVARELFSVVPERPSGRRHEITLAGVEEYSRRWVENCKDEPKVEFDVVTDVDGAPLAVGPAVPVFEFSWLAISAADADRLGIEDGQFPGVRIVRPYSERNDA